jgi:microprocessor complex subunit DGCR8
VPKSAIPCLYQKAILSQLAEPNDVKLDTEKEKSDVNKDVSQANGTATTEDGRPEILNKLSLPNVKVQTLKDVEQSNLTPDDLHDYASAVFKFKTINLYRFPKWSEQRNFNKKAKRQAAEKVIASDLLRPGLPSNVKLITVPALDSTCKPQQRNFYLNPQGKTSINILHEYVQKVLKTTVKYFVSETRNCANPYQCTVKVKMAAKNNKQQDGQGSVKEKIMRLLERSENDVETTEDDDNKEQELFALADGVGNSKKNAKLVTAKKALEHLIPGLEFDEEGIAVTTEKVEAENEIDKGANVAEIFDLLRIEDSRIADLCTRAGQPTPYLILQECLKRNSAFGDTEIQLRTNPLKRQKHEFEMIVGKHSVKVICSNKREGKQKAAQAMIQKLHPEVRSTFL